MWIAQGPGGQPKGEQVEQEGDPFLVNVGIRHPVLAVSGE